MKDVLGVILSRDRAMQLDAMLRSLFLHCYDVDKANFWVLYKTTNERNEKQYHQLGKDYAGQVLFKQQQNFRRDLLSYLNPCEKKSIKDFAFWFLCGLGKTGPPLGSFFDRIWRRTISPILIFFSTLLLKTVKKDYFVLFLVDDNLFVQDFYFEEAIDILNQEEKHIGFSLRLGKNTTYCYARNRLQTLPEFQSTGNGIIQFYWDGADGDFGYPLEVSSSLYRLQDVLPLLMAVPFDNPNTLEERMAYHARSFRSKNPLLACYQHSVAFCNPINMVQSVVPNRSGESMGYSADELAAKFEQGERIRVEAYNGFVSDACHQEIELIFGKIRG